MTAPEGLKRRGPVKVTVGGAEKTVAGGGNMLLQVDGKRNVDLSSLCDPQQAAEEPLLPGDEAGSLTVSLDGGAEFDWRRGVWTRPDNGMFLLFGTDEYWRYNAPSFAVKPGEHVLTVRANDDAVRLDAVAVGADRRRGRWT